MLTALHPAETEIQRLTRDEWTRRRDRHVERCEHLVDPISRAARDGKSHPVYDFLFDYYSFRPQQLKRWSPGIQLFLEAAQPQDLPAQAEISDLGGQISARSLPAKRWEGLDWVITLMEAVSGRPALHSCSGLHEWAMVYRTEQPRHTVPLRFSAEQIREVVESQPLVCTHYDAFRFFTPSAVPRNRVLLTKDNRIEHDQPGCIHANMDLYKWAYKFYPWISSERILEAFELALEARMLDMRASPYDLVAWGFTPVKIETKEGRAEYEQAQRALAKKAAMLRPQLLRDLKTLKSWCKALTLS